MLCVYIIITVLFTKKITLEGTRLFHPLLIFTPDAVAGMIRLRLLHSLKLRKLNFKKCCFFSLIHEVFVYNWCRIFGSNKPNQPGNEIKQFPFLNSTMAYSHTKIICSCLCSSRFNTDCHNLFRLLFLLLHFQV